MALCFLCFLGCRSPFLLLGEDFFSHTEKKETVFTHWVSLALVNLDILRTTKYQHRNVNDMFGSEGSELGLLVIFHGKMFCIPNIEKLLSNEFDTS